jgi:hypothetical protein
MPFAIPANTVALPACRGPAHWRKQQKWCAVAGGLSTGTFGESAISGTKPPFITAACTALCFSGLRQGRSATRRCGAKAYPLRALSSPHFWCADALLTWVAYGTVRLHARSHARGLHLWTWSWIVHSTAIGVLPNVVPVISQAWVGLRPSLSSSTVPSSLPRSSFGFGSGTACRYLQCLCQTHVGAVHPHPNPTLSGS